MNRKYDSPTPPSLTPTTPTVPLDQLPLILPLLDYTKNPPQLISDASSTSNPETSNKSQSTTSKSKSSKNATKSAHKAKKTPSHTSKPTQQELYDVLNLPSTQPLNFYSIYLQLLHSVLCMSCGTLMDLPYSLRCGHHLCFPCLRNLGEQRCPTCTLDFYSNETTPSVPLLKCSNLVKTFHSGLLRLNGYYQGVKEQEKLQQQQQQRQHSAGTMTDDSDPLPLGTTTESPSSFEIGTGYLTSDFFNPNPVEFVEIADIDPFAEYNSQLLQDHLKSRSNRSNVSKNQISSTPPSSTPLTTTTPSLSSRASTSSGLDGSSSLLLEKVQLERNKRQMQISLLQSDILRTQDRHVTLLEQNEELKARIEHEKAFAELQRKNASRFELLKFIIVHPHCFYKLSTTQQEELLTLDDQLYTLIQEEIGNTQQSQGNLLQNPQQHQHTAQVGHATGLPSLPTISTNLQANLNSTDLSAPTTQNSTFPTAPQQQQQQRRQQQHLQQQQQQVQRQKILLSILNDFHTINQQHSQQQTSSKSASLSTNAAKSTASGKGPKGYQKSYNLQPTSLDSMRSPLHPRASSVHSMAMADDDNESGDGDYHHDQSRRNKDETAVDDADVTGDSHDHLSQLSLSNRQNDHPNSQIDKTDQITTHKPSNLEYITEYQHLHTTTVPYNFFQIFTLHFITSLFAPHHYNTTTPQNSTASQFFRFNDLFRQFYPIVGVSHNNNSNNNNHLPSVAQTNLQLRSPSPRSSHPSLFLRTAITIANYLLTHLNQDQLFILSHLFPSITPGSSKTRGGSLELPYVSLPQIQLMALLLAFTLNSHPRSSSLDHSNPSRPINTPQIKPLNEASPGDNAEVDGEESARSLFSAPNLSFPLQLPIHLFPQAQTHPFGGQIPRFSLFPDHPDQLPLSNSHSASSSSQRMPTPTNDYSGHIHHHNTPFHNTFIFDHTHFHKKFSLLQPLIIHPHSTTTLTAQESNINDSSLNGKVSHLQNNQLHSDRKITLFPDIFTRSAAIYSYFQAYPTYLVKFPITLFNQTSTFADSFDKAYKSSFRNGLTSDSSSTSNNVNNDPDHINANPCPPRFLQPYQKYPPIATTVVTTKFHQDLTKIISFYSVKWSRTNSYSFSDSFEVYNSSLTPISTSSSTFSNTNTTYKRTSINLEYQGTPIKTDESSTPFWKSSPSLALLNQVFTHGDYHTKNVQYQQYLYEQVHRLFTLSPNQQKQRMDCTHPQTHPNCYPFCTKNLYNKPCICLTPITCAPPVLHHQNPSNPSLHFQNSPSSSPDSLQQVQIATEQLQHSNHNIYSTARNWLLILIYYAQLLPLQSEAHPSLQSQGSIEGQGTEIELDSKTPSNPAKQTTPGLSADVTAQLPRDDGDDDDADDDDDIEIVSSSLRTSSKNKTNENNNSNNKLHSSSSSKLSKRATLTKQNALTKMLAKGDADSLNNKSSLSSNNSTSMGYKTNRPMGDDSDDFVEVVSVNTTKSLSKSHNDGKDSRTPTGALHRYFQSSTTKSTQTMRSDGNSGLKSNDYPSSGTPVSVDINPHHDLTTLLDLLLINSAKPSLYSCPDSNNKATQQLPSASDYICGDTIHNTTFISTNYNILTNVIVLLCSGFLGQLFVEKLFHSYYLSHLSHDQQYQRDNETATVNDLNRNRSANSLNSNNGIALSPQNPFSHHTSSAEIAMWNKMLRHLQTLLTTASESFTTPFKALSQQDTTTYNELQTIYDQATHSTTSQEKNQQQTAQNQQKHQNHQHKSPNPPSSFTSLPIDRYARLTDLIGPQQDLRAYLALDQFAQNVDLSLASLPAPILSHFSTRLNSTNAASVLSTFPTRRSSLNASLNTTTTSSTKPSQHTNSAQNPSSTISVSSTSKSTVDITTLNETYDISSVYHQVCLVHTQFPPHSLQSQNLQPSCVDSIAQLQSAAYHSEHSTKQQHLPSDLSSITSFQSLLTLIPPSITSFFTNVVQLDLNTIPSLIQSAASITNTTLLTPPRKYPLGVHTPGKLALLYQNKTKLTLTPILLALCEPISHLFQQFIYPRIHKPYLRHISLLTLGIKEITDQLEKSRNLPRFRQNQHFPFDFHSIDHATPGQPRMMQDGGRMQNRMKSKATTPIKSSNRTKSVYQSTDDDDGDAGPHDQDDDDVTLLSSQSQLGQVDENTNLNLNINTKRGKPTGNTSSSLVKVEVSDHDAHCEVDAPRCTPDLDYDWSSEYNTICHCFIQRNPTHSWFEIVHDDQNCPICAEHPNSPNNGNTNEADNSAPFVANAIYPFTHQSKDSLTNIAFSSLFSYLPSRSDFSTISSLSTSPSTPATADQLDHQLSHSCSPLCPTNPSHHNGTSQFPPLPLFSLLTPRILPSLSFHVRSIYTAIMATVPIHDQINPHTDSPQQLLRYDNTLQSAYVASNSMHNPHTNRELNPISTFTSSQVNSLNPNDTIQTDLSKHQSSQHPDANQNQNQNLNQHQKSQPSQSQFDHNHPAPPFSPPLNCFTTPYYLYDTQWLYHMLSTTTPNSSPPHHIIYPSYTPHLPLTLLTHYFTPALTKNNSILYYYILSSIHNQDYDRYVPSPHLRPSLQQTITSSSSSSSSSSITPSPSSSPNFFTPIFKPCPLFYATWGDTFVSLSPALLYNLEINCLHYLSRPTPQISPQFFPPPPFSTDLTHSPTNTTTTSNQTHSNSSTKTTPTSFDQLHSLHIPIPSIIDSLHVNADSTRMTDHIPQQQQLHDKTTHQIDRLTSILLKYLTNRLFPLESLQTPSLHSLSKDDRDSRVHSLSQPLSHTQPLSQQSSLSRNLSFSSTTTTASSITEGANSAIENAIQHTLPNWTMFQTLIHYANLLLSGCHFDFLEHSRPRFDLNALTTIQSLSDWSDLIFTLPLFAQTAPPSHVSLTEELSKASQPLSSNNLNSSPCPFPSPTITPRALLSFPSSSLTYLQSSYHTLSLTTGYIFNTIPTLLPLDIPPSNSNSTPITLKIPTRRFQITPFQLEFYYRQKKHLDFTRFLAPSHSPTHSSHQSRNDPPPSSILPSPSPNNPSNSTSSQSSQQPTFPLPARFHPRTSSQLTNGQYMQIQVRADITSPDSPSSQPQSSSTPSKTPSSHSSNPSSLSKWTSPFIPTSQTAQTTTNSSLPFLPPSISPRRPTRTITEVPYVVQPWRTILAGSVFYSPPITPIFSFTLTQLISLAAHHGYTWDTIQSCIPDAIIQQLNNATTNLSKLSISLSILSNTLGAVFLTQFQPPYAHSDHISAMNSKPLINLLKWPLIDKTQLHPNHPQSHPFVDLNSAAVQYLHSTYTIQNLYERSLFGFKDNNIFASHSFGLNKFIIETSLAQQFRYYYATHWVNWCNKVYQAAQAWSIQQQSQNSHLSLKRSDTVRDSIESPFGAAGGDGDEEMELGMNDSDGDRTHNTKIIRKAAPTSLVNLTQAQATLTPPLSSFPSLPSFVSPSPVEAPIRIAFNPNIITHFALQSSSVLSSTASIGLSSSLSAIGSSLSSQPNPPTLSPSQHIFWDPLLLLPPPSPSVQSILSSIPSNKKKSFLPTPLPELFLIYLSNCLGSTSMLNDRSSMRSALNTPKLNVFTPEFWAYDPGYLTPVHTFSPSFSFAKHYAEQILHHTNSLAQRSASKNLKHTLSQSTSQNSTHNAQNAHFQQTHTSTAMEQGGYSTRSGNGQNELKNETNNSVARSTTSTTSQTNLPQLIDPRVKIAHAGSSLFAQTTAIPMHHLTHLHMQKTTTATQAVHQLPHSYYDSHQNNPNRQNLQQETQELSIAQQFPSKSNQFLLSHLFSPFSPLPLDKLNATADLTQLCSFQDISQNQFIELISSSHLLHNLWYKCVDYFNLTRQFNEPKSGLYLPDTTTLSQFDHSMGSLSCSSQLDHLSSHFLSTPVQARTMNDQNHVDNISLHNSPSSSPINIPSTSDADFNSHCNSSLLLSQFYRNLHFRSLISLHTLAQLAYSLSHHFSDDQLLSSLQSISPTLQNGLKSQQQPPDPQQPLQQPQLTILFPARLEFAQVAQKLAWIGHILQAIRLFPATYLPHHLCSDDVDIVNHTHIISSEAIANNAEDNNARNHALNSENTTYSTIPPISPTLPSNILTAFHDIFTTSQPRQSHHHHHHQQLPLITPQRLFNTVRAQLSATNTLNRTNSTTTNPSSTTTTTPTKTTPGSSTLFKTSSLTPPLLLANAYPLLTLSQSALFNHTLIKLIPTLSSLIPSSTVKSQMMPNWYGDAPSTTNLNSAHTIPNSQPQPHPKRSGFGNDDSSQPQPPLDSQSSLTRAPTSTMESNQLTPQFYPLNAVVNLLYILFTHYYSPFYSFSAQLIKRAILVPRPMSSPQFLPHPTTIVSKQQSQDEMLISPPSITPNLIALYQFLSAYDNGGIAYNNTAPSGSRTNGNTAPSAQFHFLCNNAAPATPFHAIVMSDRIKSICAQAPSLDNLNSTPLNSNATTDQQQQHRQLTTLWSENAHKINHIASLSESFRRAHHGVITSQFFLDTVSLGRRLHVKDYWGFLAFPNQHQAHPRPGGAK